MMIATADRCAHCQEAWYGRSVPTETPLGTMHRSCSELFGRWYRGGWQAWRRV